MSQYNKILDAWSVYYCAVRMKKTVQSSKARSHIDSGSTHRHSNLCTDGAKWRTVNKEYLKINKKIKDNLFRQ